MGIFFSYDENRLPKFNSDGLFGPLNEIEAVQPNQKEDNDTSTTDYTQEDDDQQEQQNSPPDDGGNPQDAPEDYTISNDNEGEDQPPEEADQNPPEEGTEATGGDQPPEGEAPPADGDGNSSGGGDAGSGGTDYTQDGADGGDGGEAPPEDSDGAGDDVGDDGSNQSEDEIKALEDEIYSKYSDEQRLIMSRELKGSFNKLMVLSADLVERINDIPKISDHIKVIEFISNKLSEYRDMLSDYLYYTYDTESYIKNQIAYKRFIIIMKQINQLIEKIPTIKPLNPKIDKDQD